ncbi:undecaprenyl-diphosphate phosphatase [Alicyclobacillus pomorum]|jgi:undecaprenyl-diphosphatase|uniref:undecaprenyl-diphosphate phosphatase n=1 Tax=Alicyclobacillus pomorum TaxID=204470 RepID=UPI0003FD02B1|nr:undecaprenyl-diphosphate phosphatase [Alicyclobacillus pomorum]
MTTWQAIILGIVQGVTEFLPISSSGHLVLLQKLWNISGEELLFITFLHLGTLIAVVWALRNEVRWLIRHPWSRTARMILVALIPTAVVGGLFEEIFEDLFQSGITVGFEFVITGVVLWWMDSVGNTAQSEDDMSPADALWIGTLQGAAILPALSRSGLTIAAALWRGMSREAAARFSFLLSVPAILGATVVELDDVFEDPSLINGTNWTAIGLGTLAAVIAGYFAVKGTMWLLNRSRMRIFAVYVWVLAAFVLVDQIWLHHWFPPLF